MDIAQIKLYVEEKLKNHPDRMTHTRGVINIAVKLANKFGIDEEKAFVAALLHDSCKYLDSEEMQIFIDDHYIAEKYQETPEIYHAYAAANVAKDTLKVEDLDIINAIRFHVFGRVGMSKLEEILYISDFTEIGRKTEASKECRELLDENYDKALYLSYKYTIAYLEKNHKIVYPDQYALLEFYKNKGDFND